MTLRHRNGLAARVLGFALIAGLAGGLVSGHQATTRARAVRLDEVDALLLPSALTAAWRSTEPAARAHVFDRWLRAKDAEIRARVVRADEDALVPLLLFGTAFTQAPRLTAQFFARRPASPPAELERAFAAAFAQRTDDLLSALALSADDARLSWARLTLARAGQTLRTAAGRAAAGRYLVETFARVTRESDALATGLKAGSASSLDRAHAFAERALASDTSWPINFAVSEALATLRASGVIPAAARIGRAAVIGPGLDNVDKDEGFDYYPPQSLQPFALIDALVRLQLAAPARLDLLTLDVNPRVNNHLRSAQAAAPPYLLHLIAHDRPWTQPARDYWASLGRAIGRDVTDQTPPAISGASGSRAVRLPADVLQQLTILDSNVVCERIDVPESARLDLVVATNVLLYYDTVEQALAAANIAHLLRSGGLLLTNTRLTTVPPPLEYTSEILTVFSSRPGDGEVIYAYQRRP